MSLRTFFFIFLLVASLVEGLGLSIPAERDILFRPGEQVSLPYTIQNSNKEPMTVLVEVDAGKIPIALDLSRSVQLGAGESVPYVVSFTLPIVLDPGIYPVSIRVSEDARGEGMTATAGVGDVVSIISPYATGFTIGEMSLRNRYVPGDEISTRINVRNLGRVRIQGFHVHVALMRNEGVAREFDTPVRDLGPFESVSIPFAFSSQGLERGHYDVRASLLGAGVNNSVSGSFDLGDPRILVLSPPRLIAGKQNELALRVVGDWNVPITDATLHIATDRNLFSQEVKATLDPGENIVVVKGLVPPAKDGVVQAEVAIDNQVYHAATQFEMNVTGSGLLSSLLVGNAPALVQEANGSPVSFMWVWLVVGAVFVVGVFAFLLGRSFGRRNGSVQEGVDGKKE